MPQENTFTILGIDELELILGGIDLGPDPFLIDLTAVSTNLENADLVADTILSPGVIYIGNHPSNEVMTDVVTSPIR